jgi:hypothetical protein
MRASKGRLICKINQKHVCPVVMNCCVILPRCEPCRSLLHAGGVDCCLDSDPAFGPAGFGASSTVLISLRLNGGCTIQIRAGAAQKIENFYRTVTDKLRSVAMDAILAWNCSLLSSNDGRGLRQIGIVDGSVIECALTMRGGMQGTAALAPAKRGANKQIRQCISKVESLKTLVDQAMSSIPKLIASGSALMESNGRAESSLRGTKTKVTLGQLWGQVGGRGWEV